MDSQLLFQRLIIARQSLDDTSAIFQYGLCGYPHSSLMLLKLKKPALADAIWAKLPGPKGEVQYILDGGALLHRIPWPRGFPKYREICGTFCKYVTGKYMYGAAVVIFDGYKQSSTEDMTDQRRTGAGKTATSVTFSDDMKLTRKYTIVL